MVHGVLDPIFVENVEILAIKGALHEYYCCNNILLPCNVSCMYILAAPQILRSFIFCPNTVFFSPKTSES